MPGPPLANDDFQRAQILSKLRLALTCFCLGLVISGVTAFPLLSELNLLVRVLHVEHLTASGGPFAAFGGCIVRVRDGLAATDANYPFIAYGTDWLAFGHLIIALFFIGPLIDPIRNVFIIQVGLWACALVPLLALVCGPIRGVPFFWRLIDCSFGVLAFPLLWYCLRATRRLEAAGMFTGPWGGR